MRWRPARVLVVPKREGRTDLCEQYRALFRFFPHPTVVPVDEEIVEIASDLRAGHSLRTHDAIHLATAIHAGAEAFVTTDGDLLKLTDAGVRTVHPDDAVGR